MPKKSAKKTARKTSKVNSPSGAKARQLSAQIWIAITAFGIFLVVLFYLMMTHSMVSQNPTFLAPDQQVKDIPIEQSEQPVPDNQPQGY